MAFICCAWSRCRRAARRSSRALVAACTAAGDVKPIPGMEAYIVVSGTRHNPGTIEVAGCVMGVFCKRQTWKKVN